jgi:prepilin-type N-terminal cleavage/methylation domain-containing protein
MRARDAQAGFTMIELLIASTIMLIGTAAVMQMAHLGSTSSAYSRHATEASVLAEDKLEELRTVTLNSGTEVVNFMGKTGLDNSIFTRSWSTTTITEGTRLTVTVTWAEGEDSHTIKLVTVR